MSHDPNTSHQRRPRKPRSSGWPLWITLGVLAALGAAAGSFALWNQDVRWPQAHFVTSGDLRVTATDEPVWKETSPDVTTEPRIIDPEEFRIRAGDSVSVDFPFEVELSGENLRSKLLVTWETDTRIPDAVFGRYSIYDEHGSELTDSATALGTETELELTPAQSDSDSATYTVRVHLDFAGLDDRFGEDSVDQLSDLGDLNVELHQVRPEDETP